MHFFLLDFQNDKDNAVAVYQWLKPLEDKVSRVHAMSYRLLNTHFSVKDRTVLTQFCAAPDATVADVERLPLDTVQRRKLGRLQKLQICGLVRMMVPEDTRRLPEEHEEAVIRLLFTDDAKTRVIARVQIVPSGYDWRIVGLDIWDSPMCRDVFGTVLELASEYDMHLVVPRDSKTCDCYVFALLEAGWSVKDETLQPVTSTDACVYSTGELGASEFHDTE